MSDFRSDDRVRENYPPISDQEPTEGDNGNPGVPVEYLEEVLEKANSLERELASTDGEAES